MVIQGHVEGAFELKHNNLAVGTQGPVKASTRAKIITIEGKMKGDLFGEELIVIKHSGDTKTSSTNQELRRTEKSNPQLTGAHVKMS